MREKANQADENQIDRHDEIKQARDNQYEDAAQQGHDRREMTESDRHDETPQASISGRFRQTGRGRIRSGRMMTYRAVKGDAAMRPVEKAIAVTLSCEPKRVEDARKRPSG